MLLRKELFKGAPKQHWGASYKAGNSVVMLSLACNFPVILTKNK